MASCVVRDMKGNALLAEIVAPVNIRGFGAFLITREPSGLISIIEPSTGLAVGFGCDKAAVVANARETLRSYGKPEFTKRVADRLAEYGPLPEVSELAKATGVSRG